MTTATDIINNLQSHEKEWLHKFMIELRMQAQLFPTKLGYGPCQRLEFIILRALSIEETFKKATTEAYKQEDCTLFFCQPFINPFKSFGELQLPSPHSHLVYDDYFANLHSLRLLDLLELHAAQDKLLEEYLSLSIKINNCLTEAMD